MNQMTPLQSPARQKPPTQVNPFARALAESEQNAYANPGLGDVLQNQQDSKLFSDALSRSGGNLGDFNQGMSPDFLKQQQEAALEKQRKEALKKRLHDQINPVDMEAVFDSQKEAITREIDEIRRELKALVGDVGKFHKEVELTLMTEVTDPGESGSYFKAFLSHLRKVIAWLRTMIKNPPHLSASWSNTSNGKKGKKGKQPGLQVGGAEHQKTSTIQDMMHHERSTSAMGA